MSSLFLVLALAADCLCAARLEGSVLPLSNAELVRRSSVIVYGTVTRVQPRGAHSEAVVAVECALKGRPGSEVIVTFSAGLSESPTFQAGEAVLLFLWEPQPGRFQTTGGEQGKFSIRGGRGAPRR